MENDSVIGSYLKGILFLFYWTKIHIHLNVDFSMKGTNILNRIKYLFYAYLLCLPSLKQSFHLTKNSLYVIIYW